LQSQVRKHVSEGSNVYTHAFYSYRGLQGDFQHGFVDHAETYVDGQIHTNSCENFWSLLKRALKGTYVSVEPFHLFRYLDEQVYRFNNRKLSDGVRFLQACSQVFGKRLMYTDLVGQKPAEA
jgi:transposase-like protein